MKQIMLALMLVVLVRCAASGDAGAVEAVETYLQASVDGDADTLAQVMCADMEAQVEPTARRFATVAGVRLEGMACTFDGDAGTVTCEGEIIATYGAEDTAFPLGTYSVVQEGGEWKWCGEA
ncbi:MAG: hypothetical protein AAF125_23230 [Chloroflexota bacterium]